MNTKSLRFQLPLSYAGIALLAALILGGVLLFTLRAYYRGGERRYLEVNAGAMRGAVAQMMEAGLAGTALEGQIEGLSFLVLARIRVWDPEVNLLADSGAPVAMQVAGVPREEGLTQFFVSQAPMPEVAVVGGGDGPIEGVVVVGGPFPDPGSISGYPVPFEHMIFPDPGASDEVQRDVIVGFAAPLGQSLYGYDLSSPNLEFSRSDLSVTTPLVNTDGEFIGSLQLSDGPAYGREIVSNVAQAWAVAGILAVALAAAAGSAVSRRMAAPVLALTEVTARMAEGDLSARATLTAPEELSALSRSFNDMAGRIEEMVGTLRTFVADAAHELHSPVTALRTDLEMAAANSTPELAARALTQAQRLQEIIDGLLDLSHVEAETRRDHASVDLHGLLAEMGEVYASRAEQAGIDFRLELPEPGARLTGNAAQLRSAIGNLLENAVKFTPEGGTVELGLEREGDGWRVWVADTGIGIPADELPNLFNRFHRARNAAGYAGNGLGLAIVRAIVEAHGGRVGAEGLEPGARFWIWIPGVEGL